MKANKANCGLCKYWKDECSMMRHTDMFGYCSMFENRVINRILLGDAEDRAIDGILFDAQNLKNDE